MHILLLGILSGYLLLSGCAALSFGTYSGVDGSDQVVLQKATRYWAGVQQSDVLDFDDFKLTIKPHNWHTSLNIWGLFLPLIPLPGGSNDSDLYSLERRDLFLVTLIMEPKGQELSFDPFAVIFRLSTNGEVKPKAFWGVSEDYHGCFGYVTTKLKRSPQEFIAGFTPIPFTTPACFTVLFETHPPSPEDPFVVDIAGLSKNSQPILVKPIPFVKHSGWDYSIPRLQ